MTKINLLKDSEGYKEKGDKRKKETPRFVLSKPEKLDQVEKGKKPKGGLISFFRTLFPKKSRVTLEEKEDSSAHEEEKKKVKEIPKEPPRLEVTKPAKTKKVETEKIIPSEAKPKPAEKLPTAREEGSKLSKIFREEDPLVPMNEGQELIEDVLKKEEEKPEKREEKVIIPPIRRPASSKAEKPPLKEDKPPIFKEKAPGLLKPSLSQPKIDKSSGIAISLIPEEALERVEPRKKVIQLVVLAMVLILIIGGVWGIFEYQNRQSKEESLAVAQGIETVQAEIATFKTLRKDATILKSRLDNLKTLLDNHTTWSNFLELLEKYTLSNVYYTSISGDISGQVTLVAISPDYKTASEQYLVFQEATDFVESANVSSMTKTVITSIDEEGETLSQDAVSFSISLFIKPQTFYQPASQ